jgi:hypothetical protein
MLREILPTRTSILLVEVADGKVHSYMYSTYMLTPRHTQNIQVWKSKFESPERVSKLQPSCSKSNLVLPDWGTNLFPLHLWSGDFLSQSQGSILSWYQDCDAIFFDAGWRVNGTLVYCWARCILYQVQMFWWAVTNWELTENCETDNPLYTIETHYITL